MNPFTFDWDAEVSDEERRKLLEGLAERITKRGLAMPAVWMLEIHKPIFPIAGQLGISLSPALATLFAGGPQEMQKYTKLMQDRKNVDGLIALIERKNEEISLGSRC